MRQWLRPSRSRYSAPLRRGPIDHALRYVQVPQFSSAQKPMSLPWIVTIVCDMSSMKSLAMTSVKAPSAVDPGQNV